MNKAILTGRLGKDAEVRKFDGGAVKVSFTMATSEKHKDKNGNTVENTEWHNVEMWGERAEKLSQYLAKGKQVLVEGRIHYDEYEKDGVKRRTTAIVCSNLEFLGDKQQGGQQPAQQQQYQQQNPQWQGQAQQQSAPQQQQQWQQQMQQSLDPREFQQMYQQQPQPQPQQQYGAGYQQPPQQYAQQQQQAPPPQYGAPIPPPEEMGYTDDLPF